MGEGCLPFTNAEEVDRLDVVSAANSPSPNGSASRRLQIAVDEIPRTKRSTKLQALESMSLELQEGERRATKFIGLSAQTIVGLNPLYRLFQCFKRIPATRVSSNGR